MEQEGTYIGSKSVKPLAVTWAIPVLTSGFLFNTYGITYSHFLLLKWTSLSKILSLIWANEIFKIFHFFIFTALFLKLWKFLFALCSSWYISPQEQNFPCYKHLHLLFDQLRFSTNEDILGINIPILLLHHICSFYHSHVFTLIHLLPSHRFLIIQSQSSHIISTMLCFSHVSFFLFPNNWLGNHIFFFFFFQFQKLYEITH